MQTPIAVKTLCNAGSIAILAIDEREDKITSCFYNMDKKESQHTTKIFYDTEGVSYFTRYGVKYYLDELTGGLKNVL